MTVTTNEYGQQNMFAKEPQMVVESYNRKGLESPQQYAETYNGRWAMMGIISGFISNACLLNTSQSPREVEESRIPSTA